MQQHRFENITSNISHDKLCFWMLFLVHFLVALFYKSCMGISIIAGHSATEWGDYWQMLSVDLLKTNMLESIWNLHMQPPLFNLFGAFFLKIFPDDYGLYMHLTHILLGSFLSAMIYIIVVKITYNKLFSFLIAFILALNPSLFLFEALMFYSLPAAFLVIFSVFCLSLYSSSKKDLFIYAFILSVNLLILTRSIYHIIFLLVAIPIAFLLAQKKWKKILIISVFISILSFGWYSKNYLKFGFFGASSFGGMNLWKIVSHGYTTEKLQSLADQGIIDYELVHRAIFKRPKEYLGDKFNDFSSEIEALSNNDYNHITMINRTSMYMSNSMNLIKHNPGNYIKNVITAYLIFSRPSTKAHVVSKNAEKMQFHVNISSRYFQGQILEKWTNNRNFGPFLYYLLPVSLIGYFFVPFFNCGISIKKWLTYIKTDPTMFFSVIIIIYTVLISCMFEIGENNRFKFLVEQVIWIFMLSNLYRYIFWKQLPAGIMEYFQSLLGRFVNCR